MIVPVDSLGRMTEEAGEKFAGLTTSQANAAIAEHLKETGALFAMEKIIHQYPHCWRCKNPSAVPGYRAVVLLGGGL